MSVSGQSINTSKKDSVSTIYEYVKNSKAIADSLAKFEGIKNSYKLVENKYLYTNELLINSQNNNRLLVVENRDLKKDVKNLEGLLANKKTTNRKLKIGVWTLSIGIGGLIYLISR